MQLRLLLIYNRPHELDDMYLHHASELLLKIYHTSGMSQISLEALDHYTVVYSLKSRNLKESAVEHQSA